MKKLIFNELIKLILVTFVVFSFVACGGGGSSGGDDYNPAPVIQRVGDDIIQIAAPRYDNNLPVTLIVNGVSTDGSHLLLHRDQQVEFTIQEDDYNSYSWSLDGRGVTPGTLSENGRTCTFTPEGLGNYNLLIIVTKDGLNGSSVGNSLSVELVVSE